MTRLLPALLLPLLGIGVAGASVGGDPLPRAGVVVETTAGPDPVAVAAGRAEVARLRSGGVDAELRVTRSPSETVAAAATLATRGATTLVTYRVAEDAVLAPLRDREPAVLIVSR